MELSYPRNENIYKKVALLPHVIRRFSVEFTCINKLTAAIKIRKKTFIFPFPFISCFWKKLKWYLYKLCDYLEKSRSYSSTSHAITRIIFLINKKGDVSRRFSSRAIFVIPFVPNDSLTSVC